MKIEADVDLAERLLHNGVGKFQKNERYGQTDKRNPEVTKLTRTYGTSTPANPRTN